jgi:hypothetical protein
MSEQSFSEKFRKESFTLRRALERKVILPLDKPKLWKKILKFFDERGDVVFYGEIEADYIMILNLISEELGIEVII